uniref:U6 snRNA-associated Sm-like protein LSm4 n=1 Tax=Steinernema glaseri TaxID=37863 RepID=A0A1I7ZND0_9BILA
MVLLPLSLLRSSQNRPVLVEVKSGESYNGHMDSCDSYMNLLLRNVVRTSTGGEQFTKLPEVFIRGVTIKFIRFEDERSASKEPDGASATQAPSKLPTIGEEEEEAPKRRPRGGKVKIEGINDSVVMGRKRGRPAKKE